MKEENGNRLIIAGGGTTGLAAAFIAAKAGRRVTVLEAGKSFGGLLATFPVGPTRLECFYHHGFTHDAELHWLFEELGLRERLRHRPSTMGIFRDGKIWNFNSPFDLACFSPLGWAGKLRFAATAWYLAHGKSWRACGNVSAARWLRRWAGANAFSTIWGPLLGVKFGPFAESVPLSWMVGRLRQRMGSRQGAGEERLGYPDGSLDILLQGLLDSLRQLGVRLVAEAPVEGLRVENGKIESLQTPGGSCRGEQFLITLPTDRWAEAVESADPAHARSLQAIRYFGAACAVLELDRSFSPVYWLNIADPDFPFGGVIEQTRLVPPENYGGRHLVYLSRYYAENEPLAAMGEKEILEMMLPSLSRIRPDFDRSWIRQARVFKASRAAPVCDLGFPEKVRACRPPFANAVHAGMPHVYPDERSVNNSIRVAAEACRALGINADFVPRGQSLAGQIGLEKRG